MTGMVSSMTTTGARVEHFRRERKLSLRKLAEASGVHYNTIHAVEQGREPSLRVLTAIARGLDVSVTALVDDDPMAPSLHSPTRGQTPPDTPLPDPTAGYAREVG